MLSVDHTSGVVGHFFNFERSSVKGLAPHGTLTFDAKNVRTGVTGEVVVRGASNGGSSGDAHGEVNRKPVQPSSGQWKAGDLLQPADASVCATGVISIFCSDSALNYFSHLDYFSPAIQLQTHFFINQPLKTSIR